MTVAMGSPAGAVQTAYGDWFRDLGAIDGGNIPDPDTLMLRFDSTAAALDAKAVVRDSFRGVTLLTRTVDGSAPRGPAPAPEDLASLLGRLSGVSSAVAQTDQGAMLIFADADTSARLAQVLRPKIAGLTVRFDSEVAAPRE